MVANSTDNVDPGSSGHVTVPTMLASTITLCCTIVVGMCIICKYIKYKFQTQSVSENFNDLSFPYFKDSDIENNSNGNPYTEITSLSDYQTNDNAYITPIGEPRFINRHDQGKNSITTTIGVNPYNTNFVSEKHSENQEREISDARYTDPSKGKTRVEREILCSSAPPVSHFSCHAENSKEGGNPEEANTADEDNLHDFDRQEATIQADIHSKLRSDTTVSGKNLAHDSCSLYMLRNSSMENYVNEGPNKGYKDACLETENIPLETNSDASSSTNELQDSQVFPHEQLHGELNNEGAETQTATSKSDQNQLVCQGLSFCHQERDTQVQFVQSTLNDRSIDDEGQSLNEDLEGNEKTAVMKCCSSDDNGYNRVKTNVSQSEHKNINQTPLKPADLTLSINISISEKDLSRHTIRSSDSERRSSDEAVHSQEFDIYEVPDLLSESLDISEEPSSIAPVITEGNALEKISSQPPRAGAVYDTEPDAEPGEEKRKLFGNDLTNKPWTMNGQVTENGCKLRRENSDIVLSISPKAVDVPTRVSGSVFLDIPELRNIFHLQKTEIVVAPGVEFQLEQLKPLHTHARIQIPHCMGQNVDKMQVWWFSHVRSENKLERKLVPAKGSLDAVACSEDMYWTVADYNTINIFTKHFSGFLCTACDKYVEHDIRAYLFYLFGDIDDETTLSFNLKLAGSLSRITDFEQEILSEMKSRQFTLVNKKTLTLGQRKEGCLHFSLEMVGKTSCDWHPVKRASGESVYDDHQEIALDQIMTCGREHVIATENDWYLCNKEVVKKCSVCVDVKHVIDKETKPIRTTMHGELLPPPPKYVYMGPDHNNSNFTILKKTSL